MFEKTFQSCGTITTADPVKGNKITTQDLQNHTHTHTHLYQDY